MKFLLTLFFSFLVSFQVSAQINGSSTGTVGQCSTYSLGTWPAIPGDSGNACMPLNWGLTGGGTIGQNNTSVQACWTSPGYHTVTLTDGCNRSASLQVYVSCTPLPITPSTTTACIGQQVTLTASGYTSYSWVGAIGNGSTATFTPSSAGSHTVSVTGTKGNCTTTSSVTIQVHPSTVDAPVTIQTGQQATLCASGGTSYLWTPGNATTPCITVSPTTTTPYLVKITNACGVTTLNTQVIVAGTPLSISATNKACRGQSFQARASGGTPPYRFSASIPIASQSFGIATLLPTSIGNVTITVTDATEASKSTTVLVEQTPSFSLSVDRPRICFGETATMSVVGGDPQTNYTWQIISGNGSISGGGTSATIIPVGNVIVKVTGTKNGCSFSTTKAVSISSEWVTISTNSTTVCSGNTFWLYGNGANTYEWSINGQFYSAAQDIQLTVTRDTVVDLKGVDNCGNESYAQITLSVAPSLNVDVTPETTTILLGQSATFTASSPENLTYKWFNENETQQLGTGAVFTQTPTQPTTYTLVASNGICEERTQVHVLLGMKNETGFCVPFKEQTFKPIPVEVYTTPNPQLGKNYIRSETMLTPVKTQTAIDFLPINNDGKAVAFGFFDGLGRDQQTVQLEASPTGKNIIQHIEYDEFGRMSKGFLPHTATNTLNPFQENAALQQAAFYANPIADYATTKIPYSEQLFENSPYSRVIEQAAQGEAYSLQSGHTIKASERPNTTTDAVHQWYYDNTSNQLKSDKFYVDGELWVNETKDEHHTKTWQFTDKLGRLILQRTQLEELDFVETYYVYHKRFLKKPQFIIQPEGVVAAKFKCSGGGSNGEERAYLTTQEVTNWTFRYQYDGRGRVHKKWIPGQEGESTFIYDERDRMILAQTPNQKNQNKWTFTKYDALNRPIMSGLYSSTILVK